MRNSCRAGDRLCFFELVLCDFVVDTFFIVVFYQLFRCDHSIFESDLFLIESDHFD